jgi:hypothetical protein
MSERPYDFGQALVAGVERMLKERNGQEIKASAADGSPLRVFYDGPTIVVDYHGQTTPLLGLPEKAQEEVYREVGAGWAPSAPVAKVDTPRVADKPIKAEGELNPYLDPEKNPFLKGMFD